MLLHLGPPACLICSKEIPPGRSSIGGSDKPSTTVLSSPTSHGPPSKIKGIFPCKSWKTCAAVVGDGLVDAFADGAAKGKSANSISARATGCLGIRTAKVDWPAVTSCEIGELVRSAGMGSRMVSGPGQNLAISGS